MHINKCPICGSQTLKSRRGKFRFDPPLNVPGGTIWVQNAKWEECSTCNEQILDFKLSSSIEQIAKSRREK